MPSQSSFTGASFGRYFIDGKQVDKPTYDAHRPKDEPGEKKKAADDGTNKGGPKAPEPGGKGGPKAPDPNGNSGKGGPEETKPESAPAMQERKLKRLAEMFKDSDRVQIDDDINPDVKKRFDAAYVGPFLVLSNPDATLKDGGVGAMVVNGRVIREVKKKMEGSGIVVISERDAKHVLEDNFGDYDAPPKVKPGHTRVYHGGGVSPVDQGKQSGKWVSTDRAYAEGYASKSGEEGKLYYADIPDDNPEIAEEHEQARYSTGERWSGNKELSPELSKLLRQHNVKRKRA